MRPHSNYDKHPYVPVGPTASQTWRGWAAILDRLRGSVDGRRFVLCVECYPGAFEPTIRTALEEGLRPSVVLCTRGFFKRSPEIDALLKEVLGDDPVFGLMNTIQLGDFFIEG